MEQNKKTLFRLSAKLFYMDLKEKKSFYKTIFKYRKKVFYTKTLLKKIITFIILKLYTILSEIDK